jgi:hypothetical protein
VIVHVFRMGNLDRRTLADGHCQSVLAYYPDRREFHLNARLTIVTVAQEQIFIADNFPDNLNSIWQLG